MTGTHGNVDRITLQQLLGALAAWFPTDKPAAKTPDGINWEALFAMARSARTQLAAIEGFKKSGIELPPEWEQTAAAEQAACFHLNMTNVANAVRICRILHTHGIDAACLKGVPRGYEIYGRWDIRKTGDIDLLVRPHDYREAAEVIKKNGYFTPVPSDSVWWHTYLGESPYLPSSNSGPIVDLHWKLDQPGTPAPSRIDEVLARKQMRKLGNFTIPMLSKQDALMLTATSIGKAIRAQEPWLREAHEIAISVGSEPGLTRQELKSYARSHGVERLWQFVVRQVDRLFSSSSSQEGTWDEELACSVLGLPSPSDHAMFRTQLLWLWSDGGALRPWRFAKEFIRVRAAERRHDIEEARETRADAQERVQTAPG